MTTDVEPHPLEWTPERVQRFWDYYGSNPALAETYFARMVGRSLLSFVSRRITIGQALDIGCGAGDLIQQLLERGHETRGADGSPASVEMVQRRFAGRAGFHGTTLMEEGKIPLPSQSADTVFMLEVVEHMDDRTLAPALAEARRLLRPEGHLVLTTPNEEDLDASRTMCPECGAVFHRVQHVRSWTASSLSEVLEAAGFQTVSSAPTVLSPYRGALGLAYRMIYPLIRKRRPHLVYIGRKR